MEFAKNLFDKKYDLIDLRALPVDNSHWLLGQPLFLRQENMSEIYSKKIVFHTCHTQRFDEAILSKPIPSQMTPLQYLPSPSNKRQHANANPAPAAADASQCPNQT